MRVMSLVLLMFLSGAGAAQSLPILQEAIKEVGMCYSTCSNIRRDYSIADHSGKDNTTEHFIGTLSLGEMTDFSSIRDIYRDFGTLYRATGDFDSCRLNLQMVQEMDVCYAGCLDVETAYLGVDELARQQVDFNTATLAKPRFLHMFDTLQGALQTAGLWAGYDQEPTVAFGDACRAFHSPDSVEDEAESSLILDLENSVLD